MKLHLFGLLAMTCLSILGNLAWSQESKPSYYEEKVADSDPLRVEQAQELEAYIDLMKKDSSRLKALLNPDYTSPTAYEKSIEPYRKAFAASIGYPPPGEAPSTPISFTKIGEDAIGTYHRVKIPILPGVHAEGLYIVPKNLNGKAPLVISMHGGGGSPEVATFNGGANYHDMVRGGIKRGYVVFAP